VLSNTNLLLQFQKSCLDIDTFVPYIHTTLTPSSTKNQEPSNLYQPDNRDGGQEALILLTLVGLTFAAPTDSDHDSLLAGEDSNHARSALDLTALEQNFTLSSRQTPPMVSTIIDSLQSLQSRKYCANITFQRPVNSVYP
jgi:hypothetical protein